jgi:hypothetical protein
VNVIDDMPDCLGIVTIRNDLCWIARISKCQCRCLGSPRPGPRCQGWLSLLRSFRPVYGVFEASR